MKTLANITMWFVIFLATASALLLLLDFSAGEKKVKQQLPRHYSSSDAQFERTMSSLLGAPIVGGNKTQELLNGDQIFPAMLGAIRGAKKTITFETYIYWSGDIGKQFADALSERSRAGVKWTFANSISSRGMNSTNSTTARTANCWWWMAPSASPAAWGSRPNGPVRPRMQIIGETPTSGSKARWLRRCRRPFWTTG